MSNENSVRGSQKLLAQLARKGATATPEEVKAAVSLPADSDYKLLRWMVRGIPPIFFEVETTFQMSPRQLGEAVSRFANNSAIRDINILINGTPVPDIAHIKVVLAHSGER